MSFGSPTPVEVVVSGPNFADNRRLRRQRPRADWRRSRPSRDLQYRPVAGLSDGGRGRWTASGPAQSGVTAEDVARLAGGGHVVEPVRRAELLARPELRHRLSGAGARCRRADGLRRRGRHGADQADARRRRCCSATWPRCRTATMPGEYDRYNMRRLVSMTANIEGEDLGRVAGRIDQAMQRGRRAAARRARSRCAARSRRCGRCSAAWPSGLGLAVVVIFLLLTAYFQSSRLALVAVATVPAVLAGVVDRPCWRRDTTLNIQSFMGAIMAVGVAVANAILLVTFAERASPDGRRRGGRGGRGRRARPAAADPDDQLRHDGRHGPDGPGAGRGRRADGARWAGRSSAAWSRRPWPRFWYCRPCSPRCRAGSGTASPSLDPQRPRKPSLPRRRPCSRTRRRPPRPPPRRSRPARPRGPA